MLFLSVNQVGSGQLSVTGLKWKKRFVVSTGPLTTLVFIASSSLWRHLIFM